MIFCIRARGMKNEMFSLARTKQLVLVESSLLQTIFTPRRICRESWVPAAPGNCFSWWWWCCFHILYFWRSGVSAQVVTHRIEPWQIESQPMWWFQRCLDMLCTLFLGGLWVAFSFWHILTVNPHKDNDLNCFTRPTGCCIGRLFEVFALP